MSMLHWWQCEATTLKKSAKKKNQPSKILIKYFLKRPQEKLEDSNKKNKSPEPSIGKSFPHIETVGGVSRESGKL